MLHLTALKYPAIPRQLVCLRRSLTKSIVSKKQPKVLHAMQRRGAVRFFAGASLIADLLIWPRLWVQPCLMLQQPAAGVLPRL